MSYNASAAVETIRSIARIDPTELDAEVPTSSAVDLFALTRALVFTKEEYRVHRPAGAARERVQRPARESDAVQTPMLEGILEIAGTDQLTAADLEAAEEATMEPIELDPASELMVDASPEVADLPALRLVPAHADAAEASDALTPWDLIDEVDADGGVAFTLFQRRRAARRQHAA